MDVLDNIRTFLAVAKAGSFSAAARTMDTVPSVVAKRIDQLEHRLKVRLFLRSTRKIVLTEVGERYYPRFLQIVTDVDHAFKDVAGAQSRLEEKLRIKCPTTLTLVHFGDILIEFQRRYPGVRTELVLMDRSVNPLEEGFDIAIGALPSSYANVIDIPLCEMPRVLVASPAYLDRTGTPRHPRDLMQHDCVAFQATGSTWHLQGPTGPIDVEVPTNFSVNDSHVLLRAVEKDLGITMMARHIARESLNAGRVVEVLPDYPVPSLWVKALVPENRRRNPAVHAALEWFLAACQPVAPWDMPTAGRS